MSDPTIKPTNQKIIAVAPMMAWTDRHCRFLHRLFARDILLFTEMISTSAITHGNQIKLLDYSIEEHPIAAQFGGNEPSQLARCAELAEELGYDEVNLNVGCPSHRVQKGSFGASLMLQPELVAECVKEMSSKVTIPVTVKCRLGLKNHESKKFLDDFVKQVAEAGVKRFYVHARIAILEGLSAAQNRSVPPLDENKVRLLKETFPELQIIINGGISDEASVLRNFEWADGVMIGRAAYHHPELLSQISTRCQSASRMPVIEICKIYTEYVRDQIERGEKLNRMIRPLLNCFSGQVGARRYRRVLSDPVRLAENDPSIINEALNELGLSF